MKTTSKFKKYLIAVSALYLLIIAILPVLPITQTIQLNIGESSIFYRIQSRFLWVPSQCTTYVWRTEGIETIQFNGGDTVGENDVELCNFTVNSPELRIQFPDKSIETYRIEPIIIFNNLAFQFLTAFFALGLLASVIPQNITVSILRGAELLVIWAIILVVVLEGGFRLWIGLTGDETQKILYLADIEDVRIANQNFLIMPFINYTASPIREDTNALGLRGEELTIDKPEGTFRIVALGGSTTYGDGVEWNETWPYYLQQVLREDYGYDHIEVVNGGMPAYQIANSLVNYQIRLSELNPDAVMIYHAPNDAFVSSLSQDCYRGYNLNLGMGKAARWTFDAYDLPSSAFLRWAGITSGFITPPTIAPGGSDIIRFECDDTSPPNETVHYFERNLNYLLNSILLDGAQPILSTWAYRDVQNPENSTLKHYEVFVPMINDVVRSYADDLGLPLYDLAEELEYDESYWRWDTIHQTPLGTYAQAQHYARFMSENHFLSEK